MKNNPDRSRVRSGLRVLLRGNYAEGNFGDDALLLAAHKLLQPYAATIMVDGKVAYQDRRLERVAVPTAGAKWWDAIVYGGGTQFFAFDHDPPVTRTSLVQRFIRKLVRPSEMVGSTRTRLRMRAEARTPRLAIGFGVGPFPAGSPANLVAASLLTKMALVWVRDDASADFCRRHEVASTVRSADLCFTRAFADAVHPPAILPCFSDSKRRVGIVLRDWKALDSSFTEAMVEAARRLRARGVEASFFSLAASDVGTRSTLTRLGETVVAWDCEAGALETYWSELVQMDLVVTARYHGAVFALLSETPFLAIGIEQKLQQLQGWVVSKDTPNLVMPLEIDVDLITGEILAALGQLPLRRSAGRAMLLEQRRLAEIGERRLAEFFGETPTP
jgi:polysaccharide pyruvyl transferase WcaK-like protein